MLIQRCFSEENLKKIERNEKKMKKNQCKNAIKIFLKAGKKIQSEI